MKFVMNPYETYMENSVMTATPLELVTMLYRCAIDSVEEARRCLAAGDISGRVRPINRAFDAVTELSLSLNFSQGGDMARRLADLYAYVSQKIIIGHAEQSDVALAEASRLLGTMLESWQQIASGELCAA
jgi:flagellar protein FliS